MEYVRLAGGEGVKGGGAKKTIRHHVHLATVQLGEARVHVPKGVPNATVVRQAQQAVVLPSGTHKGSDEDTKKEMYAAQISFARIGVPSFAQECKNVCLCCVRDCVRACCF